MIQGFTQAEVFEVAEPASLAQPRITQAAPPLPVLAYADDKSLDLPRRYTRLLAATGFIFGCALAAFRVAVLTGDWSETFWNDPVQVLISDLLGDSAHELYGIFTIVLS